MPLASTDPHPRTPAAAATKQFHTPANACRPSRGSSAPHSSCPQHTLPSTLVPRAVLSPQGKKSLDPGPHQPHRSRWPPGTWSWPTCLYGPFHSPQLCQEEAPQDPDHSTGKASLSAPVAACRVPGAQCGPWYLAVQRWAPQAPEVAPGGNSTPRRPRRPGALRALCVPCYDPCAMPEAAPPRGTRAKRTEADVHTGGERLLAATPGVPRQEAAAGDVAEKPGKRRGPRRPHPSPFLPPAPPSRAPSACRWL